MNGAALYILTKQLLNFNLDEDLFYQLLNMAKNQREMMRDWMLLRTIDTSITFSSSDDYTGTKSLPARFLRTYPFRDQYGNIAGPRIITSASQKVALDPIKFAEAYDYRNSEGKYYLDIKNSKIGRTGLTAGTLHLPYLQGTEDITSTRTWEFPTFAHPLLAYDVAIEHKGGIDWDTVNANQIPYNKRKMDMLDANLATWDARLQQAELGI